MEDEITLWFQCSTCAEAGKHGNVNRAGTTDSGLVSFWCEEDHHIADLKLHPDTIKMLNGQGCAECGKADERVH